MADSMVVQGEVRERGSLQSGWPHVFPRPSLRPSFYTATRERVWVGRGSCNCDCGRLGAVVCCSLLVACCSLLGAITKEKERERKRRNAVHLMLLYSTYD
jgi:hypothetical protein